MVLKWSKLHLSRKRCSQEHQEPRACRTREAGRAMPMAVFPTPADSDLSGVIALYRIP